MLLDANPFDDLQTLRHPRAVVVGGTILDRTPLDVMKADLIAAAQPGAADGMDVQRQLASRPGIANLANRLAICHTVAVTDHVTALSDMVQQDVGVAIQTRSARGSTIKKSKSGAIIGRAVES